MMRNCRRWHGGYRLAVARAQVNTNHHGLTWSIDRSMKSPTRDVTHGIWEVRPALLLWLPSRLRSTTFAGMVRKEWVTADHALVG